MQHWFGERVCIFSENRLQVLKISKFHLSQRLLLMIVWDLHKQTCFHRPILAIILLKTYKCYILLESLYSVENFRHHLNSSNQPYCVTSSNTKRHKKICVLKISVKRATELICKVMGILCDIWRKICFYSLHKW